MFSSTIIWEFVCYYYYCFQWLYTTEMLLQDASFCMLQERFADYLQKLMRAA